MDIVISLMMSLPILRAGNGSQVRASGNEERKFWESPKIVKYGPVRGGSEGGNKGMRDTFPYLGRHKTPADTEPDFIRPPDGHVLCLVVCVAEFEIVSLYARQAVINRWGIRLIQPFRRLSLSNMRHEFAEYLPQNLHIFCPARLQVIPEEEWMKREA